MLLLSLLTVTLVATKAVAEGLNNAPFWTVTSPDWSTIDTGTMTFSVAAYINGGSPEQWQTECAGTWDPPDFPTSWAACGNFSVRWQFGTNSTPTILIAVVIIGAERRVQISPQNKDVYSPSR